MFNWTGISAKFQVKSLYFKEFMQIVSAFRLLNEINNEIFDFWVENPSIVLIFEQI